MPCGFREAKSKCLLHDHQQTQLEHHTNFLGLCGVTQVQPPCNGSTRAVGAHAADPLCNRLSRLRQIPTSVQASCKADGPEGTGCAFYNAW
jgi:hypothetical protein